MNSSRNAAAYRHWFILSAAVLVTLAGGVLYGRYSQRWGPPADLTAAAARLKTMPTTIGQWSLVEEKPLAKSTQEMLECAGYVNRQYVNKDSGQTISVAIIVGPPGPIAVHTPEICYSNRAYDIERKRKLERIEPSASKSHASKPHTFWSVDFATHNMLADKLRVYYAWSLGETWKASQSPRYEFAAEGLLYKIQLAASIPPAFGQVPPDVGREFLEQLIQSGWKLSPS